LDSVYFLNTKKKLWRSIILTETLVELKNVTKKFNYKGISKSALSGIDKNLVKKLVNQNENLIAGVKPAHRKPK